MAMVCIDWMHPANKDEVISGKVVHFFNSLYAIVASRNKRLSQKTCGQSELH